MNARDYIEGFSRCTGLSFNCFSDRCRLAKARTHQPRGANMSTMKISVIVFSRICRIHATFTPASKTMKLPSLTPKGRLRKLRLILYFPCISRDACLRGNVQVYRQLHLMQKSNRFASQHFCQLQGTKSKDCGNSCNKT